eukprot:TRINITY_DN887_c3_g1_i3.p1 TRINITY_DN887_c3_g1~~TRINITY_DN887_c3_g1_i3.p1  ORF type:complete len:117 (+),score=11.72 TRINITY_DN887_c3_g1_i3:32-352(+)
MTAWWNSMHPRLDHHLHPHCVPVIEAFHACHADHRVLKFVGYCNFRRLELNECLQKEWEMHRAEEMAIKNSDQPRATTLLSQRRRADDEQMWANSMMRAAPKRQAR